jgi:hypothetical protein
MGLEDVRHAYRHEPTLDEELALAGDDDLIEMATLDREDTGLPCLVMISTRMGSHGPRVKGWFGRPGGDQPSFSVSITDPPRVVASSLTDRETRRVADPVLAWVQLNREALIDFWFNGNELTNREVQAFIARLQKL